MAYTVAMTRPAVLNAAPRTATLTKVETLADGAARRVLNAV